MQKSKKGNEHFQKTLVIPHLVGNKGEKSLRIKVVNEKGRDYLLGSTVFEALKFGCYEYVFGFEPKKLEDPIAYGTLVSSWSKEKKVTKLRLFYQFA